MDKVGYWVYFNGRPYVRRATLDRAIAKARELRAEHLRCNAMVCVVRYRHADNQDFRMMVWPAAGGERPA